MDFSNALKKVFGLSDFDDSIDDLEYYGKDRNAYENPYRKTQEQIKEANHKREAEQAAKENPQEPQEPAYKRVELPKKEVADTSDLASANDNVPDMIVARVVDIINANLSPLIIKHLDIDGQKRELAANLRPKFQELVKHVREDVLSVAKERWEDERKEIIQKLKETDEAAMQAHNEIDDLKLQVRKAEQARKNALTRSNDMSFRVEKLREEKETLTQENRKLNNQLATLKNNPPKDPEAAKLKEEIADRDKQVTEYYEKNQRLQRELSEAKNQLKEAVAGAMSEDAKHMLAEKDEEIDQLSAQVAWLHRQIDAVKEQFEKAKEDAGGNDEGSQKEIESLKNQLLNANEINADLANEIDSLKKQLEKAAKADEKPKAAEASHQADDTFDIGDDGELKLF